MPVQVFQSITKKFMNVYTMKSSKYEETDRINYVAIKVFNDIVYNPRINNIFTDLNDSGIKIPCITPRRNLHKFA